MSLPIVSLSNPATGLSSRPVSHLDALVVRILFVLSTLDCDPQFVPQKDSMQTEPDHINTTSTDLDDVGGRVTRTGPERSLRHLGLLLSHANVLLPKDGILSLIGHLPFTEESAHLCL